MLVVWTTRFEGWLTIFFMVELEVYLSVSAVCLVYGVPICDLGEEWAWVFR
jgi:hypothetical protein